MSFHQYSWNSEVDTTWISLIGSPHKTSNTYYFVFQGYFSLGIIQKLRGPIFVLFWPHTYLSWTFVDIWYTTYLPFVHVYIEKNNHPNLATALIFIIFLVIKLLLGRKGSFCSQLILILFKLFSLFIEHALGFNVES